MVNFSFVKHLIIFVGLFLLGALLVVCSVANAATPPSTICAGRPGGTFLQDVTTCSAFFHCDANGQSSRDFCRNQNFFDARQQICNYPSQVQCFQCPPNQEYVSVEFEGACNQFVRCINNRPQHLECSAGLLFDRSLGQCNHAHLVNCFATAAPPPTIQCPTIDDPNNRVFVRDANDCSVYVYYLFLKRLIDRTINSILFLLYSYYVCINGQPRRQQCITSLHFNPVTTVCDLPANTGCVATNVSIKQ